MTDVWAEYDERRSAQGFDPDAVVAGRRRAAGRQGRRRRLDGPAGCIGTPDQAREYLRRYEEAGVDQVIFVLQAGRNRHEDIMESLELFGREVLPEFAERDVAGVGGEGPAPGADDRRRRWPARPRAKSPVRSATTRSRRIPRQWADASGSEEMREWLDHFADDRAAGRRDTTAGIVG